MKLFYLSIAIIQLLGIHALPNFIIVLLDDAGIGDISAFGEPCIENIGLDCPNSKTPNIDFMAREGTIVHQMYSTSSVCSPSRAGILTSRYPIRTNVYPYVLTLKARHGLPLEEVTIAENLKKKKYYSAFVGKWHLGIAPNFLPTKQGFDYYYGLPISHNNCPCEKSLFLKKNLSTCARTIEGCPILENETVVQQPVNFETIEETYASKVIEQIDHAIQNNSPFFIHYSLHHPHYPTFRSSRFANASFRSRGRKGYYGDAMLEADYQISRVLKHIRYRGIKDNTYVFLTSDNGPNVTNPKSHLYGSPGRFRCGKTSTFEGGYRVGGIVWGGKTRANHETQELVSHLDIYPTIMALARIKMPQDRKIDGVDFSNLFLSRKNGKSKRDHLFFYGWKPDQDLFATRLGKYKLYHYALGAKNKICQRQDQEYGFLEQPMIFNLDDDPTESHPLDSSTEEYKLVFDQVMQLEQEHNCFRPEDEGCEQTKKVYCTTASGSDKDLLYHPPSPFVPYSKEDLFCCPENEQIIVPNGDFSAAFCRPCENCNTIARTQFCNPNRVLNDCDGVYCVNEHGVGECIPPSSGKMPTTCLNRSTEQLAYCAEGFYKCADGRCLQDYRRCSKRKFIYTNEMCQ